MMIKRKKQKEISEAAKHVRAQVVKHLKIGEIEESFVEFFRNLAELAETDESVNEYLQRQLEFFQTHTCSFSVRSGDVLDCKMLFENSLLHDQVRVYSDRKNVTFKMTNRHALDMSDIDYIAREKFKAYQRFQESLVVSHYYKNLNKKKKR